MPTVIVDGFKFPAKYIGKGQYSKVYRVGNRVVYYTRSDCAKEVLAMFQYDRIAHLPEMVRHDNIRLRHNTYLVFSSPFYRNVKASDTSAWKLMNKVIKLTYIELTRLYNQQVRFYPDVMHTLVDRIDEYNELPHSIINAMHLLVDLGSTCGDARFDFNKKNFGVNHYGTLIFRDPMYIVVR